MVVLWAAVFAINVVSVLRDVRRRRPWPAVSSGLLACAAAALGWSALRASEPAYNAGVALLVLAGGSIGLRVLRARRARSVR